MAGRTLIRTLFATAAISFLVSCAEYPTPPPTVAPTPPPVGYWNGDGVPGSPKIVVSISEQHAYFYKGKHLVGESTVSTGKPGFGTPPGHYTVLSKDPTHVSTVFGDYVDDFGNVVKSNIDARKDPRPPGTHYDGARMPYAMFFRGGYAMHQGYVPPYAASHGCIRVPKEMAETFFDNSPVGTPVIVQEEAVTHSVPVPPPLPATVPAVVSAPATDAPPASNLVRSTAAVRPAAVRSMVPAPTPVPLRTPAPIVSRTPAPVRAPAPAAVYPTAPAPVVSPTPAPVRSHTRRHVRSRARRHLPAPSPTPPPAQ
jgi:L,D-transpeptidase catalytic domain